jgi:hypothetical protein
MLTTGNLWLPTYTSAFGDAEWAALSAYEASFGIRQVTNYTSTVGAPSNYGLSKNGESATTLDSPILGTLTPAGQGVFAYLQPSVKIRIANAYVYKATADPSNAANGVTLTPLVTAADGSVLVSTVKFGDGRENLTMTFANNPNDGPDVNFMHTLLLSYGVVNWATRGHFMGERHVNQDIQVDDLFIDSDVWNPRLAQAGVPLDPGADCLGSQAQCPTQRMSGKDITNLVAWQKSRAVTPSAPQFQFDFAYNAEGTVAANLDAQFRPDTLTPAVKANQAQFNFINHTYDHINLDQTCDAWSATTPPVCTSSHATTYSEILNSLQQNDKAAKSLGLKDYSKDSFVNPDISGLFSPDAMRALANFGIKFVISDTSRPNQNNPSPNAGIYNALQPSVLEIPRHPTNLFYNLYAPDDWVAEYNCFYSRGGIQVSGAAIHCGGPEFDQYRYLDAPLDYNGIIDRESDSLLSYLLKGDLDPIMFHQENLVQYANGRTLLTDLLNATYTKYGSLYRLPIRNLDEHDLGAAMAARMAYDAADVTATMVPCGTPGAKGSVTLTSAKAVQVPVTGAKSGQNETYGSQTISRVQVQANTPVTVPLSCP